MITEHSREAADPRAGLDYALEPRSIAVIGASENVDKIGGRCIEYLRRFGYAGTVFAINPARTEVQGVKAYPNLDALPEVAELVIIAVPGDLAVEAVEACARHGTRIAVILAAGFGETGPAGRAQEQRMLQAARRTGLRLVGPNAQGFGNFKNGAMATHGTVFIENEPADGPVAIISQSGGGASVLYGLLRGRGVGVRYCHGLGNQLDVTVPEFALAVARDPEIKLLLLYLEGIPDVNQLEELGAVARERGLPVLVLKPGRTPAGQATSLSHTGSLATEDRVVEAFFEHHGLKRVKDFGEMLLGVELYLKGWRPDGRRLVGISNSGTACVLTADAATDAGLKIEKLQDSTRAELGKVLPSFASTANPIDITAALLGNSGMFGDVLPIVARDPGADVFLIAIPVAGRGYDIDAFARDASAFARITGKPVVIVAPQPKVAQKFKATGLPVFALESEAVNALEQFISWHEILDSARSERGSGPLTPVATAPLSGMAGVLNEADSLALVQSYGLSVVQHCLCRSEDEVVLALAAVGGLAAIKGCSSAVTHKSDIGLVRLNVSSATEARDAWNELAAAAVRAGVNLDGVIVARMVSGRRELIVGAHRDPTFGPVLTVGDGGKYVEQLPDVQFVMGDATRTEIRRAVGRLRIAKIMGGVRGEPPMDIEALCDILLALGRLITDDEQRIDSVDLNPVLLRDLGHGCMVVDAVVLRRNS